MALSLAAQGLSYAQAGQWVGCVKSTLCRWLRRLALTRPRLPGAVWELDGLWTRTRQGAQELKVIRDETGAVLATFGPWAAVLARAEQSGAAPPRHLVSDGDRAIAAGIQGVYGRAAPHQLCIFHLLREYGRNIGKSGLAAARQLLLTDSAAAAQSYARQIMELTEGAAAYWLDKALLAGRQYWTTGAVAYRTTSRLERYNRELRRRERLGTVWSEHNLLALLQTRGLLNQTT